jgi:hypothetical protein
MCLFGCNSPNGGSAGQPPPTTGSGTGTGTGCTAGSATTGCGCPPFAIRSQTVATQPANRTRTRVGIGEEVRLTTDPSTSVTWTIVADNGDKGVLSSASGTSTTYTACDRGKTVTVQAVSGCGHTETIALTVVQISGGTLESPIDISAIAPPTITVGFTGVPTAQAAPQPGEVSFLNCEMREGTCPAAATGVWASLNGRVHADTGSFVAFSATVDAHGTALTTRDTVSMASALSLFPAGGTTDGRFHWPIPWRAQVRGGGVNGAYVFATVDHVNTYTASTRLFETTKGGQRAHRTVP